MSETHKHSWTLMGTCAEGCGATDPTMRKAEPPTQQHPARAELEKERDEARALLSGDGMFRELNEKRERISELRAALEEARRVALTRPHDGSQLSEDLEGLLLTANRLLARTETPKDEKS